MGGLHSAKSRPSPLGYDGLQEAYRSKQHIHTSLRALCVIVSPRTTKYRNHSRRRRGRKRIIISLITSMENIKGDKLIHKKMDLLPRSGAVALHHLFQGLKSFPFLYDDGGGFSKARYQLGAFFAVCSSYAKGEGEGIRCPARQSKCKAGDPRILITHKDIEILLHLFEGVCGYTG